MAFNLTRNIPELNTPEHIYNEWTLLSNKSKPIPSNPNSKISFDNDFENAKNVINSQLQHINGLIQTGKANDLYPSLMQFAAQIFDFAFEFSILSSVKMVKEFISQPNQEHARSIISNIKAISASILYKLQVLQNHTEFLANPKMPNPKYWSIIYDIIQNINSKLMELIHNSQVFSKQYIPIQKVLSSNPELTTSSSVFTISSTPTVSSETFHSQSSPIISIDSTQVRTDISTGNDSQPDLIDWNDSQPDLLQQNQYKPTQQSTSNNQQSNPFYYSQQPNVYHNSQQSSINNIQQPNVYHNSQQSSINNIQQPNAYHNSQQSLILNSHQYAFHNSFNSPKHDAFSNLDPIQSNNTSPQTIQLSQQNPFYNQQQTSGSYVEKDMPRHANTNPFNSTNPNPYKDAILKFSGLIHKLSKIENRNSEAFMYIQSALCELNSFNETFNEMYSKVHSIEPATFSRMSHCSIHAFEEMKAEKDQIEKNLINAAHTENATNYKKYAESYCIICDRLTDIFKLCL